MKKTTPNTLGALSRAYNEAKYKFKANKAYFNRLKRTKLNDAKLYELSQCRKAMMAFREEMVRAKAALCRGYLAQQAVANAKFGIKPATPSVIPEGAFSVDYMGAIQLLRVLTDYAKAMQARPADQRVKAVIQFKSV